MLKDMEIYVTEFKITVLKILKMSENTGKLMLSENKLMNKINSLPNR